MTQTPMRAQSGTRLRTDIQGLRSVAVLLVLLYHAGIPFLGGGYIGVDVFFVISGFLITTHLMKSLTDGTLKFTDFWARRVRRLIPASWTVALITLAAGMLWFSLPEKPRLLQEAAATVAYIPNVIFALDGTDYLANTTPSAFQQYWSLGIEEQFYLLWPLLLYVIFKLLRGRRRPIFATVAVLVGASFLGGWWLTYYREPWAFFLLPSRAWELGVGALLAMAILIWRRAAEPAPWKPALQWVGLGVLLVSGVAFAADVPFPGWVVAIPVSATAAVILGGTGYANGTTPVGRILSIRPAQLLGKISYSVYLVHWPLLVVPQTAIGWENPLPLWVKIILAASALPLGWLSWRFIEEPWRTGNRWWGKTAARPLVVAVGGALILSLLFTSSARAVAKMRVDSGVAAQALVAADPAGAPDYVPTNMQPILEEATAATDPTCHRLREETDPDNCIWGDNPDAPLVALWGDSHASNWFPALQELAAEGKIRVQRYTKTSCPAADISATFSSGDPYPECEQWRQAVQAQIAETKPALVLIANYSTAQERNDFDGYERGLAAVLAETEKSAPVVVLQDVPELSADPIACLARNPKSALRCALPTSGLKAIEDTADYQAARQTGAGFWATRQWFCTDDACPLIQGDVLVYRDPHHITANFSRVLAAELAPLLAEELNGN